MIVANAMKRNGHDIEYFLYKTKEIIFDFDISKYDLVGFSAYTGNHIEIYECCKKLKKIGIKTVIGGPHASFFYDECKKYSDYVFKGESYISFPLLDDKKIYPLVEPDLLIPEREKFYKYSKEHRENRIKNVMTSFGCPFTCSYCYNSLYKNIYKQMKVRLRSVDSVLDEVNRLDCDLIFFQDDFFGYNKKWLKEFAKKYNKKPYHAQLRIETIDDEKIDLLKESGCVSVTIAIEAFSEEYRENILNRKMENEVIYKNCRKILESGIGLRTEQMLGLPNTTLEDELKLLKFNCSIKPTIAWSSIYQPYRGTKLGEYCVEQGLYCGNNDDVADSFFKESVLNYTEERKQEIIKLQKIFTICAHIPEGWEYAEKIIKYGNDNIKEHLYSVLYK